MIRKEITYFIFILSLKICLSKPSSNENHLNECKNDLKKFSDNLINFYKIHQKIHKKNISDIIFEENLRKFHKMKSEFHLIY